jgi:hypothetical protein
MAAGINRDALDDFLCFANSVHAVTEALAQMRLELQRFAAATQTATKQIQDDSTAARSLSGGELVVGLAIAVGESRVQLQVETVVGRRTRGRLAVGWLRLRRGTVHCPPFSAAVTPRLEKAGPLGAGQSAPCPFGSPTLAQLLARARDAHRGAALANLSAALAEAFHGMPNDGQDDNGDKKKGDQLTHKDRSVHRDQDGVIGFGIYHHLRSPVRESTKGV